MNKYLLISNKYSLNFNKNYRVSFNRLIDMTLAAKNILCFTKASSFFIAAVNILPPQLHFRLLSLFAQDTIAFNTGVRSLPALLRL
jgi:hypothetical protein